MTKLIIVGAVILTVAIVVLVFVFPPKTGRGGPGSRPTSGSTSDPKSPGLNSKTVGGVLSLTEWGQRPDQRVWAKNNISGVVLRLYWRDLQPTPSTFKWEIIDQSLALAQANNKIVKLSIAPGFYSPDWVLKQVQTAEFTVPQGPLRGKPAPLPLPWDENYLRLWFQFVTALGARYGTNPALGYVSLAGPNSHNGEAALPREPQDEKQWLKLAGSNNELENKLLAAWKKTIDHYAVIFETGGVKYTLALILDSLPVSRGQGLQWDYKQELVKYPIGKQLKNFGIQTNGLDGRPVCPADKEAIRHWDLIKDYAAGRLTGFQTAAPANLYNCRGLTKADILVQTIKNGLDFGADFVEIYESDVLDPQLQEIIASANEKLMNQGF